MATMTVRAATRQDYLDRIRRVLRFVQEHLDDDGSAARGASLGLPLPQDLQRLVGESLAEHVRRLRLERAAGDYMQIGPTFKRLFAFADSRALVGPGTISIGIYYDDAEVTPVDALRSHACISVPSTFASAPDGFELLDLPESEVAIGVHRGPYNRLEESYRWLFGQWLPARRSRQPANRRTTSSNDAAKSVDSWGAWALGVLRTAFPPLESRDPRFVIVQAPFVADAIARNLALKYRECVRLSRDAVGNFADLVLQALEEGRRVRFELVETLVNLLEAGIHLPEAGIHVRL
jgi:DNA gyrase inhibitor GyrI